MNGPWIGARRRRVALAGLALTLSATVLTGCTTARTNQGTADESCYLALPTAQKAVGGKGHLAGVRKVSLNTLRGMAPRLYGNLSDDMPAHQAVCLAAYRGHFTKDEVEKPLGRQSGPLAVAVVTTPGNKVLGTLILNRIPVRFQHQF
jgi:hypothetical protein